MYVAVVPNRGSLPAILLRDSYREAGKTKNQTLANLSARPAERIEQLRAVLRGDKLLPAAAAVEIVRALPHGHVLAALGTARRIALVLPRRGPQRRRDLALALIVARLRSPTTADRSAPRGRQPYAFYRHRAARSTTKSCLPLSGAACSSSFEATTISPSLTAAGASRHSAIRFLTKAEPCDESLFDPKRASTTAVAIRQDGGKLRLLHILVERRGKKI
jgi:hypothetical protein